METPKGIVQKILLSFFIIINILDLVNYTSYITTLHTFFNQKAKGKF